MKVVNVKRNCKICKHKYVTKINSRISNNDSLKSIADTYGISRATVRSHRDNCLSLLVAEQSKAVKILTSDALAKDLENHFDKLHKMMDAYHEWMLDPDDDTKYTIAERAGEVEIVYLEFNEHTGRYSNDKKKSTLQLLIDKVESEGKISVLNMSSRRSDPREVYLKTIKETREFVKMVYDYTQKAIEWEIKNKAISKAAADGGIVSFEKQIETITENLIIAYKKSNTEELSDLAGLPDLTEGN